VLFVDDSPPHVEGARDVGLRAALFVDAVMLAEDLHRAGLLD
jgi:FMN phosphatase YigB (HAD superfamily)